MTRFKGQGPAYEVSGGGTLTVLTDKPNAHALNDRLAGLVSLHLERALVCLEAANRELNLQPLSARVIRLAHRFFLTGANTIQDQDLERIQVVVLKTWTGLKADDVRIKVGSDLGLPGRVGHVPNKVDDTDDGLVAAKPRRPWHNRVERLDTGAIATKGTIALHTKTLDHVAFGTANLLHEASHKFAGTIDYRYLGLGGLQIPADFNDKKSALMNADSYGNFIVRFGLAGRPKLDWSQPLVL